MMGLYLMKGRTKVYYIPQAYAYPYGINRSKSMFQQQEVSTHDAGVGQAAISALLSGIQREASAIDFYSRLADAAPNEQQRSDLVQTIERKQLQVQHFTALYVALTGSWPVYRLTPIAFRSYQEGVNRAYQAGLEEYEEYRRNSQLAWYPQVQQTFLNAFEGAYENVMRLDRLHREAAFQDPGAKPFVVNIEEVTEQNTTYRTAIWTGGYLQVTVMSIGVGDDIGLEIHPDTDQFIRIEEGEGLVQMGDSQDRLDFEARASEDYAVMIPAGKWHNITNTGNKPLKIYAIYAPPHHPRGTVHVTKAEAMASEG